MYIAVEETNIEATLAVMNTAKLVVELRLKKLHVLIGFEHMTSAISVQLPTIN